MLSPPRELSSAWIHKIPDFSSISNIGSKDAATIFLSVSTKAYCTISINLLQRKTQLTD